jgi:prepilin-type N-terminal cleavage/methylation domain-containing protein
MLNNNTATAGFSLMELIIVVAILAILSVMAMQIFGPQQPKARDAKRISHIKILSTHVERYMSDNSAYPAATALTAEDRFIEVRGIIADLYGERYREYADPGRLQYAYEAVNDNFCLCAELETGMEANAGANCTAGGKTHFCLTGIQ